MNKERNPKSNTASGGIAIFCRKNLYGNVIPINRDNGNVLWVKLKKDYLGLEKEIFLGTVYHKPSGNKKEIIQLYDTLSEDVAYFCIKGNVLLQGDFNAHTNSFPDFIESDQIIDDAFSEENLLSQRNSEDTCKVNKRGSELLEFCKTQDFSILNGRKTGDLFGKITSFQWNGKGVVDYVISLHDLYPCVTYLKVGSYSPWLSDHCPLFFKLTSHYNKNTEVKDNLSPLPDRFFS